MIARMLATYGVFFEGLPEPVFFGHYYPMGDKAGPYQHALWDEFNYGRGLKHDKDADRKFWGRFASRYERDLRDLLNNVMGGSPSQRRGVVAIPASAKVEVNRITELTRSVLASNPGAFDDLTRHVTRVRNKAKAHTGGIRSYRESFDTIGVSSSAGIERYDIILVVDDILTTGTSFRSMDDRLRAAGFGGTLVNFAFCNTIPSDGAALCMERTSPDSEALAAQRAHASISKDAPIEGLVLDLDQTLLNDPVRDVDYEENLESPTPSAPSPYAPYEGTRELAGLCVPYAIVSNRPERQLLRLVGERPLRDALYPYQEESSGTPSVSGSRAKAYSGSAWGVPPSGSLPKNVFSFPTATSGDYTVRLYKPSPVGVTDAVGYLQGEFMDGRRDARIVGLGNTYEDIVAYSAAGIESALALWGVPDALRQHALGAWGADHAFGSVEDFTAWVKANTGYCKMALSVEDSDPDKAREYFELAVKAGDDVRVSAFKLAYALHDSDPVRAIPLYEAAIEAGDDYASANNLALLVQEDDPERAIALFERSIVSGNETHALRNVAKLISAKDPARAVELLGRAHDADYGEDLASDLEPMIRAGCDEAITLYERLIVAADPKRAYDLALLVAPADPERAKSLYGQAIEAGDELNATYGLGRMLMGDDPDSAEGLFRRAIDAGSEMLATNALGCVVSRSDAASAASLFERAIAAGDNHFAPVNLARLLADDDPGRAMRLLGLAAEAGRTDLGDALKPLVVKRVPDAIELYESAVIAADGKRANDLGVLVEPFDREMARRLFQQAIAAGDERYATGNLATLLMEEEPTRAMSLFERAIAAGDENFAPCNLATMVASQDPERAIVLLERSFASGDERWAGCNLGHMHLESNPDKAAELYRRAAELGETEATLGLAYLARNVEPDQSKKLLASARQADDCARSVVSMLKLIGCSSRTSAMDVARFLISSGFREANSEIVPLAFGDDFASDGAVLLGKSTADGKPLRWLVIRQEPAAALLLAESSIASMPFSEDGTSAKWERSGIRDWLNSEFLSNWISSESRFSLAPHEETGDAVFCLSEKELETLLPESMRPLTCRNRETSLPVDWWLRPEGEETMSVPYITADGEKGWSLAVIRRGVRPAIRVEL